MPMFIDLEKLYTIMIFKMKKIKSMEVFKILNNQNQTHHSKNYNQLIIPNIILINLMVSRHSQFLKKVILKIIE